MDIELHRQRRNLLGVSLALVVFETTGGTISQLSLLDGGVILKDPALIIDLAYTAMAYLLWRYWLYVRADHLKFRELVAARTKSLPAYQRRVSALVSEFKGRHGIAQLEGAWVGYLGGSVPPDFKPIPIDVSLSSNWLGRDLVIHVEDPKGDYRPNRAVHRLPLLWYEGLRIRAWLSVVAGDKAFSDLYIPYLPAFLATGVHWYRITNA